MKTYTITDGSFRMPDDSLKTVGDTIELDDDVAEANKHKLQAVESADGGDGDGDSVEA